MAALLTIKGSGEEMWGGGGDGSAAWVGRVRRCWGRAGDVDVDVDVHAVECCGYTGIRSAREEVGAGRGG